ncbi:aldehyde dehydrogenase family protein [Pelodictyon phaeoclathratiforme]|jgi:aldehyde dehydrogenase (NAD+)/aldehyde dehydrogenase (NAD(P)+)|uniref:Aldehyde dehydrogenase n=1 Tax=Pelodictyon phaeoclathratiforme (strain DSM 5477 / BU-1) TaxID=324925 RepID=B4SF93_PELPB|nr:aldehyde dehydrogenase family protein [Pelodictyon phaeoclathratiforme]ACF44672.1 Aldehyde Dehydrogenase [Pelodictyon phaeoclathratiforme BU-1]MBV5288902.1 aldehyde dehydrogenase family protein [Pelodictyon phaeoclathratiforme]
MQKESSFPELAVLRETFESGVTRDLPWRRSQLLALETFLLDREKEIAAAVHDDFRKSEAETFLTETGYLRGEIRFALKHLKSWMKPLRVSIPLIYQPAKGSCYHEPYGVVLIIGAWNYPINLSLAPLVSALAAGNCAVIKPSELAPHSSALIAEGLGRYLDRSAVRVIEGGAEVAKALLAERFGYIFYTGSLAIGREVMLAAAKHLTPLTLELGGKCPCIVEESSDLRVAARRIVWAKFLNGGQTCLAPDYVLVNEKREAELLRYMQEAITDFYGDDPRLSPDYPRIVTMDHFMRVEKLLDGSSVWSGGGCDQAERYIAPTILRGVTPASPVMQSEIFAPLLPVIAYSDLADALEIIRNGKEPLALYLFSSDRAVQERVVRHSRSGGVCINDLLFQAALHNLPFGGLGHSGFGAYHGKAGFDTFSFQRTLMHRSLYPDPDLRYPPYSSTKFGLLKRLVTFFQR